MEEFNDEKYRTTRRLKTTQQSDSDRGGTGVYLIVDTQNFPDDLEDEHFPVKSPIEPVPKFFQNLDLRTSTRGTHSSRNELPLLTKIASTPTIYLPDDYVDKMKSSSLSETRHHQDQDHSVVSPSNFKPRPKYRRSLTNKADEKTQEKGDGNDYLGMVDRSYNKKKSVIDNFAAALVARVKVKGAFHNAAENRVFDASNQELNLINDKAFIINHKEIEKKQRVIRSQRKKGGRLRMILEKHGIISLNLRKKRELASKANKNLTTMQSLTGMLMTS